MPEVMVLTIPSVIQHLKVTVLVITVVLSTGLLLQELSNILIS